jgi:hypothetical protein
LKARKTCIAIKRWYLAVRGKEVPKENEKSWAIPASFVGLIIVIVGIVGEGVFEGLVDNAETALRQHDFQILSQAELDAGAAVLDAATARKETAQLQKDTQSLKTEADTERANAAGALQKAGEANATAEREKLEREKLARELGPRTLSPEQQKAIGEACTGLYLSSPNNRVVVESYGLDGEGAALVQEVTGALIAGKIWAAKAIGRTVLGGEFNTGILIASPPEGVNLSNCLAEKLASIGHLTDITVNGTRYVGTSMSGAVMSGAVLAGGGNRAIPSALPAGSNIDILIGIRPVGIATTQ